jgi:hypothetical protein
MKRAMSGKLPLLAGHQARDGRGDAAAQLRLRGRCRRAAGARGEVLAAVKKMALFAAGVASQRFMTACRSSRR